MLSWVGVALSLGAVLSSTAKTVVGIDMNQNLRELCPAYSADLDLRTNLRAIAQCKQSYFADWKALYDITLKLYESDKPIMQHSVAGNTAKLYDFLLAHPPTLFATPPPMSGVGRPAEQISRAGNDLTRIFDGLRTVQAFHDHVYFPKLP